MKWLLVVMVLNTPVKTDLVFESLPACLAAEEAMRAEWAQIYNQAARNKAGQDTLDLIQSQMTKGTCIPAAGLPVSSPSGE